MRKLCSAAGCPNDAVRKGLCDQHAREKERHRSRDRRNTAPENVKIQDEDFYARSRWWKTAPKRGDELEP